MTEMQLQNQIHTLGETFDWAALLQRAAVLFGALDDLTQRRTVFVVDTVLEALTCVVWGIRQNLDWGVIERRRLSAEVEARFAENDVTLVQAGTGEILGAALQSATVVPGRIAVLTSGTTGLLKLIPHTAATLNTFDRVSDLPVNNWFLPYQIGSYAWYQMICLGLFVPQQSLCLGDFTDLAGSFEAALRAGQVTAISSTPTFWRHALMSVDETLLASAPLSSISLGGEIVDQAILDRLAALYPQARIRHIYASSEVGAALVVSDGRAGFDSQMLNREGGTIHVRVEDGRLFVRSPYGNRAAEGGWIDTGDLVEEREGRVYFCGRAGNSMINVGGQKAFPADIDAHLMAHPDVVWAQVTARRAPLVGYLPVAAVVLRHPMDAEAAENMLLQHCESRLVDYAIPRVWDFLDSVPMRASLKS